MLTRIEDVPLIDASIVRIMKSQKVLNSQQLVVVSVEQLGLMFKVSNLLYVDQPTGTGFSYSTDRSDNRHDEEGVSNDLYDFLQVFFAEHPEYATNDFFITGEIYVEGSTVYQAMLVDWMRNLEVGIPTLLEDGISLLIYAGNMISSATGFLTQDGFMPWNVDDSEAGLLKNYGPLSFLKVHDAGHMVPMDQPKAALEMLKRWTQGTLSKSEADAENLVAEM
ncbi:hypothetical protein P8452_12849 [Trifolium repens]|nr:hypothetical protein P8452_12849 [Trifolium repens]